MTIAAADGEPGTISTVNGLRHVIFLVRKVQKSSQATDNMALIKSIKYIWNFYNVRQEHNFELYT